MLRMKNVIKEEVRFYVIICLYTFLMVLVVIVTLSSTLHILQYKYTKMPCITSSARRRYQSPAQKRPLKDLKASFTIIKMGGVL